MPVYENSRYENADVVHVTDASGITRPTLYAVNALENARLSYARYIVQAGDHLDTLAASVLGSPELWWVIAQMNPELIDPQDLPVGTVLRVPR